MEAFFSQAPHTIIDVGAVGKIMEAFPDDQEGEGAKVQPISIMSSSQSHRHFDGMRGGKRLPVPLRHEQRGIRAAPPVSLCVALDSYAVCTWSI